MHEHTACLAKGVLEVWEASDDSKDEIELDLVRMHAYSHSLLLCSNALSHAMQKTALDSHFVAKIEQK